MATVYVDSRIAVQKNFRLTAGETWETRWPLVDSNNDPIAPLTGWTVGPLVIYNSKLDDRVAQTITDGVSIDLETDEIVVNEEMTIPRKEIAYYFKCPAYAPSGRKAILHGYILVNE